ncbi:hypothetical protein BAY1663_00107 [Pseudomonas sp. BAY1663]|nr:hypothetical protein BAY1663_00107 [Pseudomonas sp. BAY1663]
MMRLMILLLLSVLAAQAGASGCLPEWTAPS